LRHQIIPNTFVYGFIALAFFSPIINHYSLPAARYWQYYMAGIAFFAFFAFFWSVSRGAWMGLGDAKLALGIGWLFGFSKGLSAIILSFWIGTLVLLPMVFFGRSLSLKSKIAFGPFLVLGAITAFFYGDLIAGYFQII
jgi:prepilin signal peptidase PulO-like enzyme (type II secretory pathway)